MNTSNNIDNSDVDDFIDSINTSNIVSNNKEDVKVSEDDIGDFVIDQASKVIKNTSETIELLNANITMSSQPEQVEAVSNLIKAMTTALEVVNKINLQNKKLKVAKDIKQMDLEHKKNANQQSNITNNTLLISTREDVFKKLSDIRVKAIEIATSQPKEEISSNNIDQIIDVNPDAGLDIQNDG